jgi:hypothetical protein
MPLFCWAVPEVELVELDDEPVLPAVVAVCCGLDVVFVGGVAVWAFGLWWTVRE